MARELNKNEFFKVRKGYEEALAMFEAEEYKAALVELRPVLRLLERDALKTRMLASVYILKARIEEKLGKDSTPTWQAAQDCAAAIGDSELAAAITSERKAS